MLQSFRLSGILPNACTKWYICHIETVKVPGDGRYNPAMPAGSLVRAGAVLGVLGGGLRIAGSFAPILIASAAARNRLYFVIDTCLIAGLLSIYVARGRRMSAGGRVGVLVALVGLLAIRIGPALTLVDVYPVAAAAVAVGVVALAFSEWRARRMAVWIPLTFALSFALGSIGTLVAGAGALFVISGILFGSAFSAMAVTAY